MSCTLSFFPINCLMSLADLIHLRDRVHMPIFYSLLLMNPCDLNTFILHFMHFLMHPVTMTLHMPKHMRKYEISAFCVLVTVLYYLSADYCVSFAFRGLCLYASSQNRCTDGHMHSFYLFIYLFIYLHNILRG